MNNENKQLGKKIANVFNKKNGIITYSGTLAIEMALKSLNLKKESKVLVLSEVCYSIVNTILKLGLKPVIVSAKNQLYLTDDDINNVLKKEKISCILLVHQYGIYNSIDLNKYRKNGIKIIEDAAQIWGVKNIGMDSDIVVTSFGKTKPLSYGIGGGVFFNNEELFNLADYYDNDSREKKEILLSYTYPLSHEINYARLKKVADKNIKEQKKNAQKYYDLIKGNKELKCTKYDKKNAWHRFPILVSNINLYNEIVEKLKNTDLQYQLLHEISLVDLKRNKNCIKYKNCTKQKNIILLRTRNIDINKQIKILRKIMNNIV